MDKTDQQAIDTLFQKLAAVERQSPPRDAAAEAHIQRAIAANPAASYFLAQTVIVQEQALNGAQSRIEDLEAQLAERPASGGFLSSLFGGGSQRQAPRQRPVQQPLPAQGGGGFLAGAAQTAMGVAGGVLLGNAIAGMFAGPAEAGTEPEEPALEEEEDVLGDMEM